MIRAHLIERDLGSALKSGAPSDVDQKAKAVVTLHLRPHLLKLLKEDHTTLESLEKIKQHFAGRNVVRVVQLRRELAALRMGADETVARYFDRATELRDKLELAGSPVEEKDLVITILAGLTDSYNFVVEAISAEDLNIGDTLSRLQSTEARLKAKGKEASEDSDVVALTVRAPSTTPKKSPDYTRVPSTPCPICKEVGHWARDCTHPSKSGKNSRQASGSSAQRSCYVCGKQGHIARDCPQRAGAEGPSVSFAVAL